MDRLLSYKLLGETPIPQETATKIHLAKAMLNQRYTWTSGMIDLDLYDIRKSRLDLREALTGLPLLGQGLSAIGPDDWNTYLLLRFLRWVSTLLPDVTVTADNTGRYILAEWITIAGGEIALDTARVNEHVHFLKRRRRKAEIERLREAMTKAESGQFFAAVAAREYADRPEVREVLEAKPALLDGTLEEVASRLVLPWDTEWLGKS